MKSNCPACKKEIEHEDFLFEVRCMGCNTRFNPFMTVHESHEDQAQGLMSPGDAGSTSPPADSFQPPPPQAVAAEAPSEFASFGAVDLGAPSSEAGGDLGGLDAFSDGNLGDPFASAPSNEPPAASLESFGNPTFGEELGAVEPAPSEPGGFGEGFLNEPSPSADSGVPFGESNALLQELRNFGEGLPETPATPAPRPASAPRSSAPAPSAAAARVPFDPSAERLMTAGDTIPGFNVENFLSPISVWTDVDPNAEDPMKSAFEALWRQAQTRGGNAVLGMRWALTAEGKVLVTGTPVRGQKA